MHFTLLLLKDIFIEDVAFYIFDLYLSNIQFEIKRYKLRSNTTGSNSHALGYQAYNTTESENTFIGAPTSAVNTTGNNNLELGYHIIGPTGHTEQCPNIAIGYSALNNYEIVLPVCNLNEIKTILNDCLKQSPSIVVVSHLDKTLSLYVLLNIIKSIIEKGINCILYHCEVSTNCIEIRRQYHRT